VHRTDPFICDRDVRDAQDRRAKMSGDKQERIKQRAYEIWEMAGRPHGAHEVHWLQATSEIEAEDTMPAEKPKRAKAPSAPKSAPPTTSASLATPPAAAPRVGAAKAPAKPKTKA
jgi:Protein of unknown function (DUF2934)